MVWIRPVRLGNDYELAKQQGAGTLDPNDTETAALQFFRTQRPYSNGSLWVGKGLLAPATSAIDLSAGAVALAGLAVFFIMQ